MNRATPPMRDFAARLIAHESGSSSTAGNGVPAFSFLEKLQPHLAILMGSGGYRALLMRSLALSVGEVPLLSAARVSAEGALEGLDHPDSPAGREVLIEAGIILLAHLIVLLVAFIGEKLTLRLVSEVWPKLPAKHLNFSTRDKENEKTKRRR